MITADRHQVILKARLASHNLGKIPCTDLVCKKIVISTYTCNIELYMYVACRQQSSRISNQDKNIYTL